MPAYAKSEELWKRARPLVLTPTGVYHDPPVTPGRKTARISGCHLDPKASHVKRTRAEAPKRRQDAGGTLNALRAGPAFITKDATILDWPPTKGGEYRVLRKGTSEWSCLPAFPGYAHDEPGCFDAAFMDWVEQSLAGAEPRIDRVGIAYMYVGAWVPNKSGDAHTAKGEEFHVGPHIMIVSPHENQKELQSFSHDGSNGMPYVAHLPGGTDLYLVMPIRQVGEKQIW